MRKLTFAATIASFMCATAAVAAPLPSRTLGIGQAGQTDIVQVKMKKKKMSKKKMMNQGDMSGQGGMQGGVQGGGMQGGAMQGQGTEMKGGTNSPAQGGGR